MTMRPSADVSRNVGKLESEFTVINWKYARHTHALVYVCARACMREGVRKHAAAF
jgi:hypothetical protein